MGYLPNHGYRRIQTGRRVSDSTSHKKKKKKKVHMLPDTPLEFKIFDSDNTHVGLNLSN